MAKNEIGRELLLELGKSVTDAVIAAGGSDDDLRRLKYDKEKLGAVADIVVGKREGQGAAAPIETIAVPDLPAGALVALAEEKLKLAVLDSDYLKWDFVRGERGKTHEVATWKPGRRVSSEEVREHFRTVGGDRPFVGNAAAFLAWVTDNCPEGWHVTVPENPDCFRIAGGCLLAPGFFRGGSGRGLILGGVASGWGADFVFVAFRECL